MNIKPIFDLSKTYSYIVDTSYVIFCTAASAFKDYVYDNDVPKSSLGPDFDPTLDPEFNEIFRSKFETKICTAIKKYLPFSFDKSNFIFTLDCPRKEIWRRDVFPEYKLSRDLKDSSKDEYNIGKVFKYAYDKIIPDFCDETGSVIIQCSCAESDDIIAVLTKKLLAEDKNNYVIILSSDRDMVQLSNENVIIMTLQNEIREPKKEIEIMTKTKFNDNMSSSDFLLFKILIGDGSDDIPAVKKRLGPKSALKIVLDKTKSELKKLLSEDINILNGFKRNKQLISMNEIPDYMQSVIKDSIDESFKNRNAKKTIIENVDSIDEFFKDLV